MTSFDEIKAGLLVANDKGGEARGKLEGGLNDLREQLAMLMRIAEGSGQADLSATIGMLSAAIGHVEEALGMTHQVIQDTESFSARQ